MTLAEARYIRVYAHRNGEKWIAEPFSAGKDVENLKPVSAKLKKQLLERYDFDVKEVKK